MSAISLGSTLSMGASIRDRGSSTPSSVIAASGNVSWKTLQSGIEPPEPYAHGRASLTLLASSVWSSLAW